MTSTTSPTSRQRVVVIGGGFAGLNFIKHLDDRKFDIILVDRNNFHGFPPLFYQVASSGLDPTSIAFPFRRELRSGKHHKAEFHLGEVRSIDVGRQTVTTDLETISYDRLVIAAGSTNNFFGNDDLLAKVYTLKSTDEAIRIRNEMLDRFERAAIEPDPEKRRRLLSFIVIGGGPAGVEIAGALGEMKRYVIRRDYPTLSPDDVSIILMEGSDRLLRTMSEKSSADAQKGLDALMVDIHLNTIMKSYGDDNIVTTTDGATYFSEMVIWTAGVQGVQFEWTGAEKPVGGGGRIVTDGFCRVEGIDNVYAIGDIGIHTSDDMPRGLPQLAQVAIQQGKFLAKLLNTGRTDKPFHYKDKGSMATIGRNRAVADLPHYHFSGWMAWMAWMFVHLLSLLGMRSKINVLLNWMWAYFTYNTSLRLLLRGSRYPERGEMWDGTRPK